MEALLRRLAALIVRRSGAVIAVSALLTLAACIGVARMEINADLIDVLPHDNAIVARFRDFVQSFSLMDRVTVVIESKEKRADEHTDLIETIAEKLRASSLVEYVDHQPLAFRNDLVVSNFPHFLDERGVRELRERLSPQGIEFQARMNYRRLVSPLATPLDSELAARDPLMISRIVIDSIKRRSGGSPLDLSAGYYITNDHSLAFLFVKPKGKSRDMAFVKRLRTDLDARITAALAESGSAEGVTVSLAGGHVIADEVRRIIRHDIISSSLLSVFLIAGLIGLVYRAKPAVLAAIGLTTLSALAITLSVAYLLFGGLNIVTSIVAAVLIGLYVDYALHMVKRFGDEVGAGSREAALETMLLKTGPAIIVSALTTSFSFFSILATKFEGLYELGVVAGLGTLVCMLANLFLLSALLYRLSGKGADWIVSRSAAALGEGLLTRFVTGRPKTLLLVSVVVTIVLASGVAKLRFSSDPGGIGMKDSPANAALTKMNEAMNRKGAPLNLVVKAPSHRELTAAYEDAEALIAQWRERGLIDHHDSVRLFLPPPSAQRAARVLLDGAPPSRQSERLLIGALEKNGLAYDAQYIKNYTAGIDRALARREPLGVNELDVVDDPRKGHFYNSRSLALAFYLYPPAKEWKPEALAAVTADVRPRGDGWALLGESVLFREISSSIITGSILATVAAFLFNIGMVYAAFRKTRYVLLALLPVTLGFALTPGIMGWVGVPFNFINVGAIALIFGLGVDYGIYVMQAYLHEAQPGVGGALRVSGKNVFMCAATTVAGCGSLVTAEFAGIASVGLVLTIGAAACAAAALLLLPALLYCIEGKR